jgi:hypothetical protein
MEVVVKLAQQEVFFDGDLVHPSLLLVGLMSFPPQAEEQRPLQRAQQKLFPLKPHEQRGRRHAACARPKRKIAEKLGPGTLDVVRNS